MIVFRKVRVKISWSQVKILSADLETLSYLLKVTSANINPNFTVPTINKGNESSEILHDVDETKVTIDCR